jgi:hypothetical protein
MKLSRSFYISVLVFYFMCLQVGHSQDSTLSFSDTVLIENAALDISLNTIKLEQNTALTEQRNELKFVLYLISTELFDDAQYVLKRMQLDSVSQTNLRDSVTYYSGWIQYFNQEFTQAIASFSSIDSVSSVLHASAFYNAICHVQIDSLNEAKRILEKINVSENEELYNLKLLQLRGISLLQRDYQSFDSLTNLIQTSSFLTKTEMEAMSVYALDMRSFKRKSPWIAGLLSAIVPGLGKFYAGYRGIPFGAMYMTIPLGAIAAESLILAGAASLQFIALGAIFGVFYVGNIWGSILSVYAKEKEFYEELDHNIEFDMHTPIRRAFY